MTISFFSNFLNSHQLPFCKAIIDRIGEKNFRFVATEKIAPDRVAMGFLDMNEIYPFVVKEYEGEAGKIEARRLAIESDVMIIGSAPYEYANLHLNNNKLTLIYAERLFKKGKLSLLYPPKARRVYNLYTKNRNKNCHLLCASAYSKEDAMFCGFPEEKCFKWGYFPEVRVYDDIEDIFRAKRENIELKQLDVSILWVARLIEWKHPEAAIEVAKRLKKDGVRFDLNIIGIGPLKDKVQKSIEENDLSDSVHMLGAMPPQEVRNYMELSDLFLFTSDQNEGWGATLNESMNSACAVIASHMIGSVPFLIKDRENGLVFQNKKWDSLYEKVRWLIDNPEARFEIGRKAYHTMTTIWSPENAAKNLILFLEAMFNAKENPITEGPCSNA